MLVRKNFIVLILFVLLTTTVLGAKFFLSQHRQKDFSTFHGSFLLNPKEIQSFSLQGIDDQPFNNKSLLGQWTMIFFGFTHCDHLCPTTLGELAKVYRRLEQDGVKNLPRIVMISIDPQRDDLAKLKQYVQAFNPHFYGARGSEEIIKQLTKEMGIAYTKIQLAHGNNENYDVHHSGAVMLFNPKGGLSAFFTTPHQARLLVHDYKLLVT